jgi:hypothetical protein
MEEQCGTSGPTTLRTLLASSRRFLHPVVVIKVSVSWAAFLQHDEATNKELGMSIESTPKYPCDAPVKLIVASMVAVVEVPHAPISLNALEVLKVWGMQVRTSWCYGKFIEIDVVLVLQWASELFVV